MANRGHEEADLGGQDYLKQKNEYKPICEEFIIRKGLNQIISVYIDKIIFLDIDKLEKVESQE